MDWISHDLALENGLSGSVHRVIKMKCCALPGTYNDMICKHRLAALIGYGRKKWNSCAKLLKENKTPMQWIAWKRIKQQSAEQRV